MLVLAGGLVGWQLRAGAATTRRSAGDAGSAARIGSGRLDACALVGRQQVMARTTWEVAPAGVNRSDSGPPGVTGCMFRARDRPALVDVWSLAPGAAFYAEQERAPAYGPRRTFTEAGCHGWAETTPASQSAWILKHDRYVNVVIDTQRGSIANQAAVALACAAARSIPKGPDG